MGFLGLAVRVSQNTPYLRAVLLEGSDVETFEFRPPAGSNLSDQVHSVASGLAGRLSILKPPPARVVIRQGDERQGHGTGPRITRTMTEGAVLYVARGLCQDVFVYNGPQIGRACGTDKSGAEALAAALPLAEKWIVAGSAALAARGI